LKILRRLGGVNSSMYPYYVGWNFPTDIISSSWRRIKFWNNLVKFGQILCRLGAPNWCNMFFELKLGISREILTLGYHFALTLTFFLGFLLLYLLLLLTSPPFPQPRCLLLSLPAFSSQHSHGVAFILTSFQLYFAWCHFLLFTLVFICIFVIH